MSRVLRVGVLACSKTKARRPCPALDLYQGRIFRASVEYLRRVVGCERLVVLSALHHAVLDTDVVAPYELCLADLDAATRRHWTLCARARLANLLHELRQGSDGGQVELEVHAIVPAVYASALETLSFPAKRLLVGLPQGVLFHRLSTELAQHSSEGTVL